MKRTILLFFASLLLSTGVQAQERTFLPPTMGWSSWNTYHADISEQLIKSQADAAVAGGFKDAGYNYINIDEGFFWGRDANNYLKINPTRFPNGLRPVVDYIHSKGLKAGTYSEAGHNSCASGTGETGGVGAGLYNSTDPTNNHDDRDLRFHFIENDFDFIKIDYCGANNLNLVPETRYTQIKNAIDAATTYGVATTVTTSANVRPGRWYKFASAGTETSGKYMSTDGTNMKGISDAGTLSDASIWTLESATGGYKIRNKAGQYLASSATLVTSGENSFYTITVTTDATAAAVFTLSQAGTENCLFTHTTPPTEAKKYLHFDINIDNKGFYHDGDGAYSQFKLYEVTPARDVVFNMCCWRFPGAWCAGVADSWRVTGDIQSKWSLNPSDDITTDQGKGVKEIIKENLYLSAYCADGHYNDMDMLEVGVTRDGTLTADETFTHFAMWCIMSSPLLIGCDMTTISDADRDLLTNPELIALNQDRLGLQAYVAKRMTGSTGTGTGYIDAYVLVKDVETLHGTKRAVAFCNLTDNAQAMSVNFHDLDLYGNVQIRDLGARADVGTKSGAYSVIVPAHGTKVYTFTAERRLPSLRYEAETAWLGAYQEIYNNQGTGQTAYPISASIDNVAACSGGISIGWLGKSNRNDLTWKDVYVAEAGTYTAKLRVRCNEDRTVKLSVNGGTATNVTCNSGSWDNFGDQTITLNLNAGSNTVRLYNETGNMPDVDYMDIVLPVEWDSKAAYTISPSTNTALYLTTNHDGTCYKLGTSKEHFKFAASGSNWTIQSTSSGKWIGTATTGVDWQSINTEYAWNITETSTEGEFLITRIHQPERGGLGWDGTAANDTRVWTTKKSSNTGEHDTWVITKSAIKVTIEYYYGEDKVGEYTGDDSYVAIGTSVETLAKAHRPADCLFTDETTYPTVVDGTYIYRVNVYQINNHTVYALRNKQNTTSYLMTRTDDKVWSSQASGSTVAYNQNDERFQWILFKTGDKYALYNVAKNGVVTTTATGNVGYGGWTISSTLTNTLFIDNDGSSVAFSKTESTNPTTDEYWIHNNNYQNTCGITGWKVANNASRWILEPIKEIDEITDLRELTGVMNITLKYIDAQNPYATPATQTVDYAALGTKVYTLATEKPAGATIDYWSRCEPMVITEGVHEYKVYYNEGNHAVNGGERNCNNNNVRTQSFNVTAGDAAAVTIGNLQTDFNQALYWNKTDVVVPCNVGETITIDGWQGVKNSGMMTFIYLDTAGDGFACTADNTAHTVSGDLMTWTTYSFQSSPAVYYKPDGTGEGGWTCTLDQARSFTAPEVPGVYRMRYKVDWNSIDAAGTTNIAANGGIIVDFMLEVNDPTVTAFDDLVSGWYRIRVLNSPQLASATNQWLNGLEKSAKVAHVGAGVSDDYEVTTSSSLSLTNMFYVDVTRETSTTATFRLANGDKIGKGCSLTYQDNTVTITAPDADKTRLQMHNSRGNNYWAPFAEGSTTLLGAYGDVDTGRFSLHSATDMVNANYDVYTVVFKEGVNAGTVVTYDNADYEGLKQLGNGGVVFMPKGSTLTADDFTLTTVGDQFLPGVKVDNEAKTITVDLMKVTFVNSYQDHLGQWQSETFTKTLTSATTIGSSLKEVAQSMLTSGYYTVDENETSTIDAGVFQYSVNVKSDFPFLMCPEEFVTNYTTFRAKPNTSKYLYMINTPVQYKTETNATTHEETQTILMPTRFMYLVSTENKSSIKVNTTDIDNYVDRVVSNGNNRKLDSHYLFVFVKVAGTESNFRIYNLEKTKQCAEQGLDVPVMHFEGYKTEGGTGSSSTANNSYSIATFRTTTGTGGTGTGTGTGGLLEGELTLTRFTDGSDYFKMQDPRYADSFLGRHCGNWNNADRYKANPLFGLWNFKEVGDNRKSAIVDEGSQLNVTPVSAVCDYGLDNRYPKSEKFVGAYDHTKYPEGQQTKAAYKAFHGDPIIPSDYQIDLTPYTGADNPVGSINAVGRLLEAVKQMNPIQLPKNELEGELRYFQLYAYTSDRGKGRALTANPNHVWGATTDAELKANTENRHLDLTSEVLNLAEIENSSPKSVNEMSQKLFQFRWQSNNFDLYHANSDMWMQDMGQLTSGDQICLQNTQTPVGRANFVNNEIGYANVWSIHPTTHKDIYITHTNATGPAEARTDQNPSAADDSEEALWLIREVVDIPVYISSVGWASLCLPAPITVPDNADIGIYKYYSFNEEKQVMRLESYEPGTRIEKGTGVILKGKPGIYQLAINYETDSDGTVGTGTGTGTGTEPMLKGATARIAGVPTENYYALADISGVGFYLSKLTYIPSNKAYIVKDTSKGMRARQYIFDISGGTETGLEGVTMVEKDDTFYDLSGRSVPAPARGVYVTSKGKKVLFNK